MAHAEPRLRDAFVVVIEVILSVIALLAGAFLGFVTLIYWGSRNTEIDLRVSIAAAIVTIPVIGVIAMANGKRVLFATSFFASALASAALGYGYGFYLVYGLVGAVLLVLDLALKRSERSVAD
jgi:hypothetical protein